MTTAPEKARFRFPLVTLGATVVIAALVVGWAMMPKNKGGNPPVAEPEPTPEQAPPGPAWFRNVTRNSGIDFTYQNGQEAGLYTLLETLGGGIALLDYDGDGLLDIFLTGGGSFDGPSRKQFKGRPCKLFRNLGDFQFEDVTATVGLDKVDWWYTHGVAVADYDRDGWPDFVVTGYGRLALFHNQADGKGGRMFVDVTDKLGLKDDLWSTSAGWADLDSDGFPDLYVCHYCDWSFANDPVCPPQSPRGARDICPPMRFKPLPHALFRNNKGAGFTRWDALGPAAKGHGLGVVLTDLNDDGRPDIYVANDTTGNLLFFNRGERFDEAALAAGVATDETGKPNGSMGVDAADFDGSGRPSLWATNFQGELHALYRNFGKESFLHHSRPAGVAAIGLSYVGFGTGFLDADNDGWEDLIIAHGHVYYSLGENVQKQRPIVLRNTDLQGRRVFKEGGTSGEPFFQTRALGRGLAIGDLNNDGWPDVVIVHSNTPVAVLRNVAAETAPANWVGVKLVGTSNRDVVGSTVVAEVGDRKLTRFAKGGGSYMSANDPRILFGLGSADKVARVTVRWSWGKEQTWENLSPGAYWELREGDPAPRKLAAAKK